MRPEAKRVLKTAHENETQLVHAIQASYSQHEHENKTYLSHFSHAIHASFNVDHPKIDKCFHNYFTLIIFIHLYRVLQSCAHENETGSKRNLRTIRN